jgi:hypothetical protein
MLLVSKNQPIAFVEIPLNQVPSWSPIARLGTYRRGSQWDGVLTALERKRGIAVRIDEEDAETRNRYKSTLQTQAKNWGLDVKVRSAGNSIYAWLREEIGRYSPPQKTGV